ncbi:DUF6985 domain-containing protein [Hymenobacter negativus]|uniref:DUF6985 domain-containing protein n=1 Tax=Hymenobacter negativus TaxID=2795026 RepID=A0ABS3QLQ0_9BACT|nr:hypothetical protein [Hymenobacter negativus]MBO2011605.1 hypothetical protein [Hymenobacter negativus]
MTRDELLRHCTWDDYDFANITVESALFGCPVQVRFLPELDSGRIITERMVAVLNDFLALSPDELPTVKQLLWADCLDDFENINYGFGPDTGEPELVVNQREFGIYSADDAYAQSNLTLVSIPEEPTLRHRYGAIEFEPAWAGHGCSIIMKDGQLIATYSNDYYFGRYEDDAVA